MNIPLRWELGYGMRIEETEERKHIFTGGYKVNTSPSREAYLGLSAVNGTCAEIMDLSFNFQKVNH
jgi:hypothetical protein